MKTKFSLLITFLMVVFLLTACSISITTKINADGSGELGFTYKFTQDDLTQLGGMGLNADTICTDLQSQGGTMPEDQTFKQEKHGDETWCVASQKFDNLETSKAGLSAAGLTINTLEINADQLTFDAVVDLSGQDTTGMENMPVTINYELTVPGKITNHNANKLNGNTAVWNLTLSAATNIHLESSLKTPQEAKPTVVNKDTSGGNEVGSDTDSGGGSKDSNGNSVTDTLQKYWWAIVIALLCCCLVVLAIVVVVVLVARKKKA